MSKKVEVEVWVNDRWKTIEIDFSDIEDDIEYYAENFMGLTHKDNIETYCEYEDISDFPDDEIEEYAEDHLDMIKRQQALNFLEDDELCEELEGRGYMIVSEHYYPQNSIRFKSALDGIYDNLDRIPVEEIERLNEKYGL